MLDPCPRKPNCVSSLAGDARHRVEPLRVPVGREAAREAVRRALLALPRTRIVADEPARIAAECRSAAFGFVDDVEVVLGDEGIAHVRSAARVGWWDLGVNRRRVELLRQRLASAR